MALRIKQKKRKPLDTPLTSPPLSEEERLRTGIHKVVKLAEQNELSRALRLLESLASEAKHISDTEARSDKRAEQIRGLHPNASENDKLPTRSREDREISDLALTMDDLEEGLNQLPALSAGAMSPWTYDLIKCAAGKRGDENFRATILRVFNLILAGKGGDPEYWVSSRLVAIGKPDGGLRPIAVGEVWYRFLASMVARITGKDIGPSLAPCQYGVAISAGGELIIHLTRMVEKLMKAQADGEDVGWGEEGDPLVMLAVDYENAFNKIHRLPIYKGVRDRCPQILKFFVWGYGKASPLYLGNGVRICDSETGVRQGDPLGPLLFALALQPLIEELNDDSDLTGVFYLDDGLIVAKRSVAVRKFGKLCRRGEHIGLFTSYKKTLMWDRTAPDEGDVFSGIKRVNTGLKVLGAVLGGALGGKVGSTSLAGEYLKTHLENRGAAITLLDRFKLPENIAFILMRACINARPTFLMRTLPPDQTLTAAKAFDTAVDNAIGAQARWQQDLPETAKQLRGLPLNLAGCAVRRMETTRDSGYAASFLQAAWHIHQAHNKIWKLMSFDRLNLLADDAAVLEKEVIEFQGLDEGGITFRQTEEEEAEAASGKRSRGDIGAVAAVRARARAEHNAHQEEARPESAGERSAGRSILAQVDPTNILAGDNGAFCPFAISQKTLQGRKDKTLHQKILASFPPLSSNAAWLLSGSDKRSASWLRNDTQSNGFGFPCLTKGHFTENLRLRLLLPLFNPEGGRGFGHMCKCGRKIVPGRDDQHGLHCHKEAGRRNGRHNRVRDLLCTFIRGVVKGHGTADKETPVANSSNAAVVKIADIRVQVGAEVFFVDVGICSAANSAALSAGSSKTAGKASEHMETRKVGHWTPVLGKQSCAKQMIPFVVEAGGKLGFCAGAFLDKLCGMDYTVNTASSKIAGQRRFFMKALSAVTARSNAEMQIAARENATMFFTTLQTDDEDYDGADEGSDSDEEEDASTPSARRPPESQPQKDEREDEDVGEDKEGGNTTGASQAEDQGEHPRDKSEEREESDSGGSPGSDIAHKHRQDCQEKQTSKQRAMKARPLPPPPPTTECPPFPPFYAIPNNDYAEMFKGTESCKQREKRKHLTKDQESALLRGSEGTGGILPVEVIGGEANFTWSIRATKKLTKGQIVGEYTGTVRLKSASEKASFRSPFFKDFVQGVKADNQRDASKDTILDAGEKGSVLRFVEGDCQPNCVAKLVVADFYPRLIIVTRQAIAKGEILTVATAQREERHSSDNVGCGSCRSCRLSRSAPPPPPSPPRVLAAYTDGSSRKGDMASWGIVVVERGEGEDKSMGREVAEMYGAVVTKRKGAYDLGARRGTNNTGEGTAIAELLLWFKHYCPPSYTCIYVYTDSEFSLNVLEKKNQVTDELAFWTAVRKIYDELKNQVQLRKVKAHAGIHWNEKADRLAKKGATEFSRVGRHGTAPPLVTQRTVHQPPPPQPRHQRLSQHAEPFERETRGRADSEEHEGKGGGGGGKGREEPLEDEVRQLNQASEEQLEMMLQTVLGDRSIWGTNPTDTVRVGLTRGEMKGPRAKELATHSHRALAEGEDITEALVKALSAGNQHILCFFRRLPADEADNEGVLSGKTLGNGWCGYAADYGIHIDWDTHGEVEQFIEWLRTTANTAAEAWRATATPGGKTLHVSEGMAIDIERRTALAVRIAQEVFLDAATTKKGTTDERQQRFLQKEGWYNLGWAALDGFGGWPVRRITLQDYSAIHEGFGEMGGTMGLTVADVKRAAGLGKYSFYAPAHFWILKEPEAGATDWSHDGRGAEVAIYALAEKMGKRLVQMGRESGASTARKGEPNSARTTPGGLAAASAKAAAQPLSKEPPAHGSFGTRRRAASFMGTSSGESSERGGELLGENENAHGLRSDSGDRAESGRGESSDGTCSAGKQSDKAFLVEGE